jgi:hypothetical protein
MNKYDNIIIRCFFTTKLRKTIISKFENNLDKYTNIVSYLKNRYSTFEGFRITLYRIFNHVDILPRCKYCNCELPYEVSLKSSFCCQQHRRLYQVQETKKTCINKYGVENVMQVKEIADKVVSSTDYKTRTIKAKETLQKLYGVDYIGQLPQSIKNSHSDKAVAKQKQTYKETCLNKYGVTNTAKLKHVKDKIKETCLNKYGVTNVFASDVVKSKLNYIQQIQHGFITKRKNNTFKISTEEEICFNLLSLVYKNIERQYKTDLYPFACDFYIHDINTFIEYNGTWTHGGHPFDSDNTDDLNTLHSWKLKKSKYYDNAIKTWTEYDVNKRKTAALNNLNFIEFWSIQDVCNFILTIPCVDKKLQQEFNYYKTASGNLSSISTNSKRYNIIKYFQQNVFYKNEIKLFQDKNIRDKLIDNRKRYLNKDTFTVFELLTGFKIAGIHYGYSHFNPLWFKWFIEKYNVTTCYDPCGGWGHRLLGGLNLKRYIYNDLSTTTYNNINNIINYFGITNTVTYNNDACNFIPNEEFE